MKACCSRRTTTVCLRPAARAFAGILREKRKMNKAIDFIKSHANVVEKAAEAEKTEDAQ